MCVIGLGVPVKFIIPSFDVLSVELRHMKIKEEECYDFFISSDSILSTLISPEYIIIQDVTITKVSPHNN